MAEQQPQQKGGRASAQPGHGAVSAAEVEKYIGGIDFPCDKNQLVNHARQKGAPQEVMDLMNQFPEKQYGSAVGVARGISDVKQ